MASAATEDESAEARNSYFECNICLDVAKDPVVSLVTLQNFVFARLTFYFSVVIYFAGRVFISGLKRDLTNRSVPFAKPESEEKKWSPFTAEDKVRRKPEQLSKQFCLEANDPRKRDVPPRPQGQRPEPDRRGTGAFGNPFGLGGMQFSFGIGAFPFGFLGLNFGNGIQMPRTHVCIIIIRETDKSRQCLPRTVSGKMSSFNYLRYPVLTKIYNETKKYLFTSFFKAKSTGNRGRRILIKSLPLHWADIHCLDLLVVDCVWSYYHVHITEKDTR